MRSRSGWRDGKAAAPKQRFRPQALWVTCLMLCGLVGRAPASEIVIGRQALQTLVVASVFQDQGRWYLLKGNCYAYLEHPHVSLGTARVIIDAHLSSHLGVTMGDSCVGTDLMSDIQVSGKLVGSGSHIEIVDIRIDNVQDESTRQIIQLLQSATGESLPRSVTIDILPLLEPASVPGTIVKVAATNLVIANVATLPDAVEVTFEIKLTAR